MRGKFLHNRVIVERVQAAFQALGATVHPEFPTRAGRDAGFVDLFVELGRERIVCEAELTTKRVCRDLVKAAELDATLLLIVTPNARVAWSIRTRIRAVEAAQGPVIFDYWVHPLGVALQRVTNSCRFRTGPNVPVSLSHKTPAVRRGTDPDQPLRQRTEP